MVAARRKPSGDVGFAPRWPGGARRSVFSGFLKGQSGMASFETSVRLRAPIDEVFDFLARPANVKEISSPKLGLSFTDAPEVVTAGCKVEFKVQNLGLVQEMTHEFSVVESPNVIQEIQIKGPLKMWVHDHLFEATPAGGVTVIDRIAFEPPSGLMGMMVTADRLIEQLEEGFDHRYMRLEELFGKHD